MYRIPLDQTWQPSSPLLIIDFRVALFQILYSSQRGDYYLQWQSYLNRLPIKMGLQSAPIIIVDDQKGGRNDTYWRQDWLNLNSEYLPKYKGQRLPKPDVYDNLYKKGIEYIKTNNIDYFASPSKEADDWAGLVFRLKQTVEINAEIIFCTIDQDWQQLVDDKLCIKVYCDGNWKQISRLKDELEVLLDYKADLGSTYDIVDHKMAFGDAGDNIVPGSPREIIDLRIVPPDPHNFSLDEEQALYEAIKRPKFITNKRTALEAAMELNNVEF